jgi:selenocysteine-specific elongation factor
VVDPLPPRRRAPLWNRLDRDDETLGRVLLEAGAAGVTRSVLAVRTGLSGDRLQAMLRRPELAVTIGQGWYHPSVVAGVADAIEQLVNDEHRRSPLGDGLAVAAVPAGLRIAPDLVDHAIESLSARGKVERRGAHLATAGWRPVMGAVDSAYRDRILADLRAAGPEPPDVAALTELHQRDPVPILRLLEREGLVVAVEPGPVLRRRGSWPVGHDLRDGMTERREYSPAELRDVLGLSRKYLIPFLEYCDRKRITERRATGRVRVAQVP